MRQLAQTGWMHNRARMVVASFLTKDLLIDWRWGEQWFMQHLLDGDPAANNGGWQWTAGTGTDAAPYFRIFNPVSQSTRHDPHGDYIRKYVPELRDVPQQYIHEPWKMPDDVQTQANCILGEDLSHADCRPPLGARPCAGSLRRSKGRCIMNSGSADLPAASRATPA